MAKRSFTERSSETIRSFLDLYALYVQFYRNDVGYFPYRGCLREEYEEVMQLYQALFGPELDEDFEDEKVLQQLIVSIEKLERLSQEKARSILENDGLLEIYRVGPLLQMLTNEDYQKIQHYEKILQGNTIVIHGVLGIFVDNGPDVLWWHVKVTDEDGSVEVYYLEEGQLLTVFNEDGTEAFAGIIMCDTQTGWFPSSSEKPFGSGQQYIGYAVPWVQKGVTNVEWAKMFYRNEPLRATVVKPLSI